ncbi:MAG TPA: hypothetical protein VK698_19580 [Kofleriaceae bacterium]|nr:hypothetical protein [Kofleriaceae bacterium]
MIRHSSTWLAAAVSLLPACTDFDLPSALTREQIIAVRSDPAALQPGTRAKLDAVIAGPDGLIDDAELTWSIDPPIAGASVEIDDDGGAWLAIDQAVGPGAVVVALEVETASGPITARKTVEVGDDLRANPGAMGLRAAGEPIGDELSVSPGADVTLSASIASVDDPQISWYATVGEIERFRHNPTELLAPDEPADGWLIAVVRDGVGGVSWETRPLIVGP